MDRMQSADLDIPTTILPARSAKAVAVSRGGVVTVINTHGGQVVDTWAFSRDDLAEFMSMEHSRASMMKLNPQVGDTLVTNRRQPILTIVADTTPGVHDTLIAACDRHRYIELGVVGYHASCTDNLRIALGEHGLQPPETPAPLNLFMNVPVLEDGRLEFLPPVSQPGQYVSLRAEMDLLMAFSACPQDMLPVNGFNPTEVHYRVEYPREVEADRLTAGLI